MDALASEIWNMNQVKGFHTTGRSRVEEIALINCEACEAIEEIRAGKPPIYTGENGKPEGVAIELADVVIRALDTLHDLYVTGEVDKTPESVIREKLAYNATRPFRHGKKF